MQIEVSRQSQPGALMMMSNHKYGCNFFLTVLIMVFHNISNSLRVCACECNRKYSYYYAFDKIYNHKLLLLY